MHLIQWNFFLNFNIFLFFSFLTSSIFGRHNFGLDSICVGQSTTWTVVKCSTYSMWQMENHEFTNRVLLHRFASFYSWDNFLWISINLSTAFWWIFNLSKYKHQWMKFNKQDCDRTHTQHTQLIKSETNWIYIRFKLIFVVCRCANEIIWLLF